MSDEKEEKTKGKAVEVKLREDFDPNNKELSKMQQLARSVSPFMLDLLEAKETSDGK